VGTLEGVVSVVMDGAHPVKYLSQSGVGSHCGIGDIMERGRRWWDL
jgi:hypothetical protein